MKTTTLPKYLLAPLPPVGNPVLIVGDVRRALQRDATLQRKACAPRETLLALAYVAKALKKLEGGASLAEAFNLGTDTKKDVS